MRAKMERERGGARPAARTESSIGAPAMAHARWERRSARGHYPRFVGGEGEHTSAEWRGARALCTSRSGRGAASRQCAAAALRLRKREGGKRGVRSEGEREGRRGSGRPYGLVSRSSPPTVAGGRAPRGASRLGRGGNGCGPVGPWAADRVQPLLFFSFFFKTKIAPFAL